MRFETRAHQSVWDRTSDDAASGQLLAATPGLFPMPAKANNRAAICQRGSRRWMPSLRRGELKDVGSICVAKSSRLCGTAMDWKDGAGVQRASINPSRCSSPLVPSPPPTTLFRQHRTTRRRRQINRYPSIPVSAAANGLTAPAGSTPATYRKAFRSTQRRVCREQPGSQLRSSRWCAKLTGAHEALLLVSISISPVDTSGRSPTPPAGCVRHCIREVASSHDAEGQRHHHGHFAPGRLLWRGRDDAREEERKPAAMPAPLGKSKTRPAGWPYPDGAKRGQD